MTVDGSVAKRAERRGPFGLLAVLCCGLAVALVLADVTLSGFAEIWVDHALTAGFVSSGLFLLITILVVDEVLKRRDEARTARIAAQYGRMLLRQAQRVVVDAAQDLWLLAEADKEEKAAAAAQRESTRLASDATWGTVSSAIASTSSPTPFPMAVPVINPRILRRFWERQRIRREIVAVIQSRSSAFEAAVATAVPFLSSIDAGLRCVQAGFDLVEQVHTAARMSDPLKAQQWFTGDQIRVAVDNLKAAVEGLDTT